MISFLLNDEPIHLYECKPDLTVLEFLRERKRLTGTKEGCASGDCGACTVVIAEATKQNSALTYRAINSCITFMSALHGKQLITVEHLTQNGQLHTVQQSLLDHHGSQCGFCTPGFIMSMFAYYHHDEEIDRAGIERALSGNLCRCTGYRPIIDATAKACSNKQPDNFDLHLQNTLSNLAVLESSHIGLPGLYMPKSREELAETIEAFPDARIVAGSTDLALESTQHNNHLSELISLEAMPGMRKLEIEDSAIKVGATVTLSELETPINDHIPQLNELIWRFASRPIRNQATLAGNIANASPIGDFPPVLLALGGKVVLDDGKHYRSISASDFFTAYRQTAKRQDEWISSVELPIPAENQLLRAYKVSKREEDDISAVCAVFNLTLSNGAIVSINTGFGGVAATPAQANGLIECIKDKNWSEKETMLLGKKFLRDCFQPIDDVRASAEYRRTLLANLWHRFWLETANTDNHITTRVVTHA